MAAVLGTIAIGAATAAAGGLASKAVGGLLNGGDKGGDFQAQGMQSNANMIDQGNSSLATTTANQNRLVGQLGAEAAGGGPVNDATNAALNNATNQNNQMEAGSVASTKGINPALAAYIGAQNAGQARQNSSNAAAGLTAQNAMNAQGQQAGVLAQQGSQALNQSQIGQSGMNAANSSNSGVAVQNSKNGAAQAAGIASGIGSAVAGPIGSMFGGGGGADQGPQVGNGTADWGGSGGGQTFGPTPNRMFAKGGDVKGPKSHVTRHLVDAKVSPGEIYLPPAKVAEVLNSSDRGKAVMQQGERIPGKAKVAGNSYSNDTVSKKLEAGGIVVPRSKVGSKNDAGNFVAAVAAKKGLRKGLK